MSLIDMIEQERYDWGMVNNPADVPQEAYLRIKQLSPWSYHRKGEFEHNCIKQWLYFDEKLYRNWIYDLDHKKESA